MGQNSNVFGNLTVGLQRHLLVVVRIIDIDNFFIDILFVFFIYCNIMLPFYIFVFCYLLLLLLYNLHSVFTFYTFVHVFICSNNLYILRCFHMFTFFIYLYHCLPFDICCLLLPSTCLYIVTSFTPILPFYNCYPFYLF